MKLTISAVEVIHLLKTCRTGTSECLVAGETQVAAASVVGATAISATYRRRRERNTFLKKPLFICLCFASDHEPWLHVILSLSSCCPFPSLLWAPKNAKKNILERFNIYNMGSCFHSFNHHSYFTITFYCKTFMFPITMRHSEKPRMKICVNKQALEKLGVLTDQVSIVFLLPHLTACQAKVILL